MRHIYIYFLLMFLFACSSSASHNQPNSNLSTDSTEYEYIKVRDAKVNQFKKYDWSKASDSLNALENSSLLDLEKRLINILKTSEFAGKGNINLQTLYQCLGFGMLDGLTFIKDSMRIVYTSKNIFFDYFKESNHNLEALTPKDLENIFQRAFISEAALTNFSSLKLISSSNIHAYGLIGKSYQIKGPWIPDELYVLASKGNFIYLFEKQLKKPIIEILKCRSVYDKINSESEIELDKYRASKLKDTTAFNKHLQLWNEAWNKYCDCYQKELKKDTQFLEIQKQFGDILRYIDK